MPTVLISAPYLIPYLDRFQPVFERHCLELKVAPVLERLGESQLLTYAGEIDGVICGDDQFTARVLEACSPRLKVISKWGTGIDSIDGQAASRLGIRVFRTPNAFTLPVTDTILGYMLAFARHIPWLDREMRAGQWVKIPGRSLSECTLGVIGVGNIGKEVLRRGRVFGMRLLGNDILEIPPDFLLENQVEMTGLEELLRRSDFVSLNPDLNPSSYHLLNSTSLAWMKPDAILINTSRGQVIDEAALIEALRKGVIAGAALDVFEIEPLPSDSPLLKMDQVLLAPHASNSSPSAWESVHWSTIYNLLTGLGIPYQP